MSDTAILLGILIAVPVAGIWFVLGGPSTEAFERLIYLFDSLTGKDAAQSCTLTSPVDAYTFATDSGSLVTYFLIRGSRKFMGPQEALDQAAALNDVVSTLFGAGSGLHTLSFGFRSDPANGKAVIKRILEPSLNTALRFGCDKAVLGWMLGDKLQTLSTGAVDELAVVAVHSHMSGLSRPEREKVAAQRDEAGKKLSQSRAPNVDSRIVQTPYGTSPLLMSRHEAACKTFKENMEDRIGLMLDTLTVEQASTQLRRFIDASHYAPEWHAKFIGAKPGGAELQRATRSADGLLPPPVGRQLIVGPIKAHFGDVELARHNRLWYAPLVLEVAPQEDPVPYFNQLATALSGQAPWQMSMELLPNGLGYNKMETMFLAIMGAAGEHNQQVARAYKELRERNSAGDKPVAIRALFFTWGNTEAVAADRLNLMRSVIESWGQAGLSNEIGNPDQALIAAAPGLAKVMPAPYIPAPLSEAVRMLPLARPASVYDDGQLICFTREGNPYPIRLGHPELQQFWGTLTFAPSGSGKSFLMNMFNGGALFSPGLTDLPLLTLIDKGPSAKGVVMYAKAVLPPEKAAQIEYWRPLPDDISYACNPLDTYLMCDQPTAEDLDYVVSVLASICPNLGPEGSRFLSMVVQQAYEDFGRASVRGKKWQWSLNEGLSAKLASVGIHFDEEQPPFVWEVAKAFFSAGMFREAQEAQYHAVPTIPDLARVVGNERIQAIYGDMPTPTNEPVTKVFTRNIQTAAKEYGLLCAYTRHSADVRFKVIDIEGLAGAAQSEEGMRRFGVMMLFARRLGAREYFLRMEDLKGVCPPEAVAYHARRLEGIQEQLKFLMYDEVHNMRGVPAAQARIEKDAREGRKYFVVGMLSSQELQDFPKELVNQCTNFFIMGCANAEESKKIAERFDLTESERLVILRELVRPGRFFCIFKTKRGMLSQLLYTRPGPIEKWAFSTSPSDTPLRDALYAAMGPRNTLMFLAKHFPSGSAAAEIDRVRIRMGGDDMDSSTLTRRVIKGLRPQLQEFCDQQQFAAPPELLEND